MNSKTLLRKPGYLRIDYPGIKCIAHDHYLNWECWACMVTMGQMYWQNDCDVLIAVGMRFDDRVTGRLDKYAKQAKIIHLDIDPQKLIRM